MGLTSSFGKFPVMPVPVFPVGVPFPWISTSPYPDGTLLCDGSSFSTVTYPELAVVFPTGVLPDLRGVALRGRDNGKGLDVDGASRAVGSYQADELKSHFHTNGGPDLGGSTTYGEGTGTSSSGVTGYTGGTETRMKNIAVDWLVYAETIAYDLTLNQGNALTLGGYSASYFTPLSNIPSLIKSNLNVSGDAPMGVCRAWVNFDGTTTTPTIRGSMNVSSITDNGTGDYTINFTTPMTDSNYCITSTNNSDARFVSLNGDPTVSGFRVSIANATPSRYDVNRVTLAVFR